MADNDTKYNEKLVKMVKDVNALTANYRDLTKALNNQTEWLQNIMTDLDKRLEANHDHLIQVHKEGLIPLNKLQKELIPNIEKENATIKSQILMLTGNASLANNKIEEQTTSILKKLTNLAEDLDLPRLHNAINQLGIVDRHINALSKEMTCHHQAQKNAYADLAQLSKISRMHHEKLDEFMTRLKRLDSNYQHMDDIVNRQTEFIRSSQKELDERLTNHTNTMVETYQKDPSPAIQQLSQRLEAINILISEKLTTIQSAYLNHSQQSLSSIQKIEDEVSGQIVNYENVNKKSLSEYGHKINILYRQIDSLISMYSVLKLEYPLPIMRGWAISPDFADLLIAYIGDKIPKLIVELGSGASTLIMGYCLKRNEKGRVISFEHKKDFFDKSVARVKRHKLEDYVEIRYAPLSQITIKDKTWNWYQLDQQLDLTGIDMLLVDGPPGITGPLARYPALPVLYKYLNRDAIIFLDDGVREDETKIKERWLQEFPDLSSEVIDNEKKAIVFTRR